MTLKQLQELFITKPRDFWEKLDRAFVVIAAAKRYLRDPSKKVDLESALDDLESPS